MVDAQCPGAAHAGAQGVDEKAVLVGTHPVGAQRRQAPTLAIRVELVRWCAHGGAWRKGIALAPHIGTRTIDRHRQVQVQADGQTERLAAVAHSRQLPCRLPLQVLVEPHACRVLACKARHLGTGRIPVRLGPDRPAPDQCVGSMKRSLQCLEQGMAVQRIAALGNEVEERLAQCIARTHVRRGCCIGRPWNVVRQVPRLEIRIQQFEHFELEPGHADMVDQRRFAQRDQPQLELGRLHALPRNLALIEAIDSLHVNVEHVELQPRRRAVRAGVGRVVREQRVQGIESDDAGALLRDLFRELRQIAEITNAPVARRTQGVELHGRTPDLAACLQCLRPMAMRRRADHERVASQPVDGQAVVARWQAQRQLQAALTKYGSIERDAPGLGHGVAVGHAAVPHSTFLDHVPTQWLRRR